MSGFLKLNKTEATEQLLGYPAGFVLLTQIALRTKRDDSFNKYGLVKGQALIGDYSEIGLTRQEYRTALGKLVKWHFITIQTTNKGTVVTICNSDIYDLNLEESNQQPNQTVTIKQPTANHQATTNKEIKNKRNKEIKNTIPPDGGEQEFSESGLSQDQNIDLEEIETNTPPSGAPPSVEPTDRQKCLEVYCDFFARINDGVKPKIDAADGKALNTIMAYLKSNQKNKSEPVTKPLGYILENWHLLDDFTQKQTSLKQINSNLNSIITQIKKNRDKPAGKQDSQGKSGYSMETTIQAGMDVADKLTYIDEQRRKYPERYYKHAIKGWLLRPEFADDSAA